MYVNTQASRLATRFASHLAFWAAKSRNSWPDIVAKVMNAMFSAHSEENEGEFGGRQPFPNAGRV